MKQNGLRSTLKSAITYRDERWSDHMVLVRSSFTQHGILKAACVQPMFPINLLGHELLETAHVKDLLSLLRVIANPLDDIAWMRFSHLYGMGWGCRCKPFSATALLEPEFDLIFDKLNLGGFSGNCVDHETNDGTETEFTGLRPVWVFRR